MELTPRLQAIAQQVPQGTRLADIGTDHGYLPAWLLLNGRISYAIAADLREGPLERSQETAQRFGVAEQMSFRLCDGLSGISPDEADVIAIAGMGGETIASILEAAPWTKEDKLLLLQPMSGFPELRQWLQSNGYVIENEHIACEGKRLYSIWLVKGGAMLPLSPAELWAGRQSNGPLRRDYLALIRGKAEKALRGRQAAHMPDQAVIAELEAVLSGLREMEAELEAAPDMELETASPELNVADTELDTAPSGPAAAADMAPETAPSGLTEAGTKQEAVPSEFNEPEKEWKAVTTVGEVFELLQEKAPFELQEGFDNAGFLVGRKGAQVSKILVSLDITEVVVQEAAEQGAQLIVAHHPVIFGGVKAVTDQTVTGRVLLALVENGIAAICAHTNLDAVEGGVNDALALRLGLTKIAQLKQEGVDGQGRPYGIGRVGYVPEQALYDFSIAVKRLLGANGLRLVDGGKPVRKVAVGGGACADMMGDALAQGCDTFVTSDVKYHNFLEAKALGLNLIDAGHFPTEDVVCAVLQDWLIQQFPAVSTSISQRHFEVFSYL